MTEANDGLRFARVVDVNYGIDWLYRWECPGHADGHRYSDWQYSSRTLALRYARAHERRMHREAGGQPSE